MTFKELCERHFIDIHLFFFDSKFFFHLLWLFHLYGFNKVFILDGGFPKWSSENRPVDSKVKKFEKFRLPALYREELVVDLNQVRCSIGSNDVQIVDARPLKRFLGAVAEPRKGVRRGNIPSSINLFYGSTVNGGLQTHK